MVLVDFWIQEEGRKGVPVFVSFFALVMLRRILGLCTLNVSVVTNTRVIVLEITLTSHLEALLRELRRLNSIDCGTKVLA